MNSVPLPLCRHSVLIVSHRRWVPDVPPSRLVVLPLLVFLSSSTAAGQVCASGEFRGRPNAPVATSETRQGLVQGQAIDIETGQPLAQVLVMLTDANTSAVNRVMTDARGMFQFSAVTPRTYDVSALRIGYSLHPFSSGRTVARVSVATTVTLCIRLYPDRERAFEPFPEPLAATSLDSSSLARRVGAVITHELRSRGVTATASCDVVLAAIAPGAFADTLVTAMRDSGVHVIASSARSRPAITISLDSLGFYRIFDMIWPAGGSRPFRDKAEVAWRISEPASDGSINEDRFTEVFSRSRRTGWVHFGRRHDLSAGSGSLDVRCRR